MKPKPIAVAFLFFLALASLVAQDQWWMLFESGKKLYREGRFGESLVAFRTAVNVKRDVFERAGERLEFALSTKTAKAADGKLSALVDLYAAIDFRKKDYAAMKERAGGSLRVLFGEIQSSIIQDPFQALIDALDPVLEVKAIEDFGDSLVRLGDYIRKAKDYPEAEYWIALVFRQEGETAAARAQLEKAKAMSDALEIPETRHSISYSLAENLLFSGNSGESYKVLRDIMAEDPEFAPKTPGNERMKDTMISMLKNAPGRNPVSGASGFDKFMSIYRLGGMFALDAYRQSGRADFAAGRHASALVSFAFAANIVATRVIDEFKTVDSAFAYSTLGDLLSRLGRNAELYAYADKLGLFESLYFLALSLSVDSDPSAKAEASYILGALAATAPGEWAMKAKRQARSPNHLRP